MSLIQKRYQEICFYSALALYALFGSPTPDHFGWVEAVLGALLLYAVRLVNIRQTIVPVSVLILGLSVPLITSAINGQASEDIIRDIIPFLFLFLPLFYGWAVHENPDRFLWALGGVGLAFSLRTIWTYRDVILNPSLWGLGAPADLLYLANSPEVLFASLYCLLSGGQILYIRKRFYIGSCIILLSFIPLTAMTLMMQRAGVGLYFLSFFVASIGLLYFYPKRALLLFIFSGVFAYFLWPFLGTVGDTLIEKTQLVGFNSRFQEWTAVFDVLSSRWDHLLFGEGWGGRLENPAVGGLSVNYTHSLLSSLLLKTGVLGVAVVGFGVLAPARRIFYAFWTAQGSRLFLGIAILSPFFVSTFLYASYKSLGFGLILLAFLTILPRKLEKNPISVS